MTESDPLSAGLPDDLAALIRDAAAAEPDAATARTALACLDLTSLNEDDTPARIETLIDKALGGPVPVAAVCLYPAFVAQAVQRLAGRPVRVATVVNFPTGEGAAQTAASMAAEAVASGADEVDAVLPWRAFLAGDRQTAFRSVAACKGAIGNRPLKVILETSRFPDAAQVAEAATLAVDAGADFLKTSTGKVPGGATLASVALLWRAALAADRPVGVKASGGVRTASDAAAFLALTRAMAGADAATPDRFRFGASGLYDALLAGGGATGSAGY